jgi:hypothetical protein
MRTRASTPDTPERATNELMINSCRPRIHLLPPLDARLWDSPQVDRRLETDGEQQWSEARSLMEAIQHHARGIVVVKPREDVGKTVGGSL